MLTLADHFVFPEYKLGNIRDHSLIDMLYGEQQQEFSRLNTVLFPASARSATWSLPVMENAQRTAS